MRSPPKMRSRSSSREMTNWLDARVALAAGTAAQLVVHAPGLVALGAEDEQAPGFHHALAQLDVGTAAGHVGGDGDGALLAGVRDDASLLCRGAWR